MNPAELDELLRATLADGKLSGSEKSSLQEFALREIGTPQDQAVARSRAFEVARQAVENEAARQLLTWLESVVKVLAPPSAAAASSAPAEAFFSPGDTCLGQIIHRLNAARTSADICVFTITDDRIAKTILDAQRRRVAIRIITDNDKANDEGSDIERLDRAGIPVRIDRTPFHMHHKYSIFDGQRLLTGSYNWTRGAATSNEENLIDTGDPRLLAAFTAHFAELWEQLT